MFCKQLHSKYAAAVVVSAPAISSADLGGSHQLRPMAVAHCGTAQVSHQRNTGKEVLDTVVQALQDHMLAITALHPVQSLAHC